MRIQRNLCFSPIDQNQIDQRLSISAYLPPGGSIIVSLPPLSNQPLTIYFVGGFFFGASLEPGFEGLGWWGLLLFMVLVQELTHFGGKYKYVV